MTFSSASHVKIGLVQEPPVFLNKELSINRACELIEQAAQDSADLLVFPETWLVGYPIWLDYAPTAALWDHPPAKMLYRLLCEQALKLNDPGMNALQNAVDKAGIWVVLGAHEYHRSSLYNTMFFFAPEQPVGIHRKLMPTYTERLIWGRGDGSTLHVMDTPFGKVGGLICWEHWMPLARAAMHAKQELIHIAQWPMVKDMNTVASRHYAFEGQCFTVASGCVLSQEDVFKGLACLGIKDKSLIEFLKAMQPDEHGLFLKGNSAVFAPDGSQLGASLGTETDLRYVSVDPRLRLEAGLFLDTDGHYSRPDVFTMQVNTKPQQQVCFQKS